MVYRPLCIIFEMSLEDLQEVCNPLPNEQTVAQILQRAVQEKIVSPKQLEILEGLSGRYGPMQPPKGFESQINQLTNRLSGSRDLLRLVGITQ